MPPHPRTLRPHRDREVHVLKLVLPKGSLEEQTLRLFEAADLRVRRGSDRDYHGTVDDERIERVSILRPQEIPLYVQDGLFDLGITGQDWIAETDADVEVVTTLSYARSGTGHGTQVVLAVPNEHPANSAKEIPPGHPDLHRVPEAHRAILRRPRDPRQGRVVLRRDGGEGPRDRRRDRRHDRDGKHAPRARDEDHRDAPHLGTGPDREPRCAPRHDQARGDRGHPDPAARRVAGRGPRADQAQCERGPAAVRSSTSSRR